MLTEPVKDKLDNTLATCAVHHQRMMFAYQKIKGLFPLNQISYSELSGEQISFADQLIYRFSKLQDLMGNKLFRLILEGLQEDVENLPFIDVLNKLEKLKILNDTNQWLILRETRNLVTHEYPFNVAELIEGLNELPNQTLILSNIWHDMKAFVIKQFNIIFDPK